MDIYDELVSFYRDKSSYESFDDYTFRKKGMTTFEYLYSLGPVAEASAAWYRAGETLTGFFLPLPDRDDSQAYRSREPETGPVMYAPRPELPEPYTLVQGPGGLFYRRTEARPSRPPPQPERPPVTPGQYADLMALYYGTSREDSPVVPVEPQASLLESRIAQVVGRIPPELILERVAMEDTLMSSFDLATLANSSLLQTLRFPILYNQTTSTFVVAASGRTGTSLVSIQSTDPSFDLLRRLAAHLSYSTIGPVVIAPKLMSLERDCGSIVLRYGPSRFKVPCDLMTILNPIVTAAFAQQGLNVETVSSFQF